MSQILIRAPEEIKKDVATAAKQRGLTVNALMLQILWDWLKAQKETA